jgi:hypothetical protein
VANKRQRRRLMLTGKLEICSSTQVPCEWNAWPVVCKLNRRMLSIPWKAIARIILIILLADSILILKDSKKRTEYISFPDFSVFASLIWADTSFFHGPSQKKNLHRKTSSLSSTSDGSCTVQ